MLNSLKRHPPSSLCEMLPPETYVPTDHSTGVPRLAAVESGGLYSLDHLKCEIPLENNNNRNRCYVIESRAMMKHIIIMFLYNL